MLFPLRQGPLNPGVGIMNGWAITSYYGGRRDPLTGRMGTHGGMDLAYSGCTGQDMIAVVDGWCVQSWDASGGGWWSSLTGDDGSMFGYGHASKFVNGPGSRRVKAGDVIAYVGTSGGSTGPHLHFAYRPPGSRFYADPYDLLVEAADPPPPPAPEPEDEDEMTPEQMQELKSYIDQRLEQVAAADRAHMAAIADQRAATVIEAVVRVDEDDEAMVTQKRDELLAVLLPKLERD